MHPRNLSMAIRGACVHKYQPMLSPLHHESHLSFSISTRPKARQSVAAHLHERTRIPSDGAATGMSPKSSLQQSKFPRAPNPEGSISSDVPAVGFAAWRPGETRRYAWPLFGLADIPPLPPEALKLINSTFQRGARYLGDETTWLDKGSDVKWIELAVVGRSNVGKSSLLNALLGSADHKFVKVSRYPGSTAHLDFYAVGTSQPPALVLVDTPGYGYNKKGRGAESMWMELLTAYLQKRGLNVLPRALLLLDARHGITDYDAEVMHMFDMVSVPYHVVMTKVDEVSAAQLENTAVNLAKFLATKALPFPVLNAVSARDGVGMQDLHKAIMLSTKLHKVPR